MRNAWQHLRFIFAAAIVAMLLSMPCPEVFANNGNTTAQNTNTTIDNDTATKSASKAKPKSSTTRVKDKSVLDAEVLDSPLAYFKEAFTPEDESDDSNAAPALINTVKALVATLLSTVI
ncbi:hypothetical protein [Pontibacter populi]|uniref:Uncharacterized protein n=1 Tax=Pontibacter populi TaxID=890055 RepID=A0ABV1RXB5_9BACT